MQNEKKRDPPIKNTTGILFRQAQGMLPGKDFEEISGNEWKIISKGLENS